MNEGPLPALESHNVLPETKSEAGRRTLPVPEFLQPYLCHIAKEEGTGRFTLRAALEGLASAVGAAHLAAKVPVATAHGMGGLHGTLAVERGATTHVVAQALGHESVRCVAERY